MKIAIEAQRIFRKEKHGMDYVALETIRELQKIDQQNEYFILVSPGDDVCLQESANMHIVTVNWPCPQSFLKYSPVETYLPLYCAQKRLFFVSVSQTNSNVKQGHKLRLNRSL